MQPLISVIVPVYGVEQYLDRCVESIVNQTYQNLEIILVDDESPDRCPEMCDEWAKRDNRIRVIHKENAGAGAARNSGLDVASGIYLMFVDSDDYLSRDAVSVMFDRIEQDDGDMVIGKNVRLFEDGYLENSEDKWMNAEKISPCEMLELLSGPAGIVVVPWGKLYKASLFQGLRYPHLICCEDTWLFPHLVLRCKSILFINHVVYYYLIRNGSLSKMENDEKKLAKIEALLHVAKELTDNNYGRMAAVWYGAATRKTLELDEMEHGRYMVKHYLSRDVVLMLKRELLFRYRICLLCVMFPCFAPVYVFIEEKIKRLRCRLQ